MLTRAQREAQRAKNVVVEPPNDLLDLIKEEGLFRDADEERGWLLPYIDVVTLLLSLFVIMVAMQDTQAILEETAAVVEDSVTVAEEPHRARDPTEVIDQDSLAIGEEFQEIIERERLGDLVHVQVEQSRVKLQIRDSILFPLGAADLTPAGLIVLDKITPVISENPFRISIEGHTDSLPILTSIYPSNWELSSARASTVLRFLIGRGMDSRRGRAIGYADTLPLESNQSSLGRAANRRVSLVVFPGKKDWLDDEPDTAPQQQ